MIHTFWLVTGYQCNNRCEGCYAAPRSYKGSWMDLGYAKEIMETMEGCNAKSCIIIGGEPTLYPSLLQLISFGASKGLKMIIVSNGRRFKDRDFAKAVYDSGIDRVVISIEGARRVTHNRVTGRNSFTDTCTGIQQCAQFGVVNTLTTISALNQSEILEVVKFSYELGANKAVLNCAIPIVSEKGIKKGTSVNPLVIAQVIDKVVEEFTKTGHSLAFNATIPLCLIGEETLATALDNKWFSVGCHMYRGGGVAFDHLGNVLPCTHFSESPMIEGAIDGKNHFGPRDTFSSFWQDENSEAGKFRHTLWRYPAKRCRSCHYWGGCIGGCPLLWAYYDPQKIIDRTKGGEANESARCCRSAKRS